MEEKKSKFKEFCEKHETAVDGLMIGAMIGVSYAVGCMVGHKLCECRLEIGLQKCCRVDPELQDRFFDACKKVKETIK